jgi:hypothetical protein
MPMYGTVTVDLILYLAIHFDGARHLFFLSERLLLTRSLK